MVSKAKQLKPVEVDNETEELLIKFAGNDVLIKQLKSRIRKLEKEQNNIFETVRPKFGKGKRTKPIKVKNHIFNITFTTTTPKPYKDLFEQAAEVISELNTKAHNKLMKLKEELCKPSSKEKITYMEVKCD